MSTAPSCRTPGASASRRRAFAQHPSISKIPARHAGYVKAVSWGTTTIKVTQHEARFFERAASVPKFDVHEYDAWVALKK